MTKQKSTEVVSRCIAGLALVLFCIPCVAQVDDTAAINALFDRIERAYVARDVDSLSADVCDEAIVVMHPPNDPKAVLVMDKIRITESLKAGPAAGLKWKGRRFVDRSIVANGPFGFLSGTSVDEFVDGKTTRYEGFWVVYKQGDAWRILLTFPRFARSVVMIRGTVPQSQSASLGLLTGDVVTSYAGRAIRLNTDLVDAVKEHSSDPSGRKIPLVVERKGAEMTFEVGPGTLGVLMENRFLPDSGASLVSARERHPIKETVSRTMDAVRRGDVEALIADSFPGGFLRMGASQEGVLFAGVSNAREIFKKMLQYYSQAADMNSLKVLETRAIVKDDLALAACRVSGDRKDGRTDYVVDLSLFVQKDGKWYSVCDLPIQVSDVGLDPSIVSAAISPDETARRDAERQNEPSVVGIGVNLEKTEKGILIKQTVPGGPAEKAGLKPDSIVTAVDGIPTKEMSVGNAVKLITGDVGTQVELTVLEPGDEVPRKVAIVREKVVLQPITSRIIEPNVGYLDITRFDQRTPDVLRECLTGFASKGVKVLVLDLRRNSGGMYDAAANTAGLLIGQGPPFWLVRMVEDGKVNAVIGDSPSITNLPMVALIGENTSGAGELLASALKTGGRAKTFGAKTAGMAAMKKVEKLPDGSSREIITGNFLTADGKAIFGEGISPDHYIDSKIPPEEALKIAIGEIK